ncbi:methyltransferase family protein [Candidatus Omnitrophus magneticus]|uniref:Methyltransferase family protein n=1 Tax=Candidatus Omnitrophus magneticus TaxID=1609969 RepID=A0A0F0CPM6_9BACT|nr:methyltransferase family protein [Candidatus Omnitrophus magneticus]
MNLAKLLFYDKDEILSKKFDNFLGLSGSDNYSEKVVFYYQEMIEKYLRVKSADKKKNESIHILDIGCGKYSFITPILKEKYNCELSAMDISEEELSSNNNVDEKIIFDACDENYVRVLGKYKNKYDLIVTSMFLEHAVNPNITHKMIFYLLKNNGFIIHAYPTLYDPVLFMNYIMPHWLSRRFLYAVEPSRKTSGKFDTYYKCCRGFSRKVNKYYAANNARVLEWENFYGTRYFYRIFTIQALLSVFYVIVLKLKLNLFTSASCVVLTRDSQT